MKTSLKTALQIVLANAVKPAKIRKTILIKSPPSCGKTQGLNQIFEGRVSRVDCTRLNEDIGQAMPAPNFDLKIVEEYLLPKFFEIFKLAESTKLPVCLNLDEYLSMSENLQKMTADILDQRDIAGRRLPDNVTVVATGNGKSDASGAKSSLAHIVSRVQILEISYEPEGVLEYAIKNNWHNDIIAFISRNPMAIFSNSNDLSESSLRDMLKESAKDVSQYAHSRGWEALSQDLLWYDQVIAMNEARKLSGNRLLPVYEPDIITASGYIGDARATEFIAMRGLNLPTHADLLEGKADFPSDPLQQWRTVTMVALKISMGNAEKSIDCILKLSPSMVEVFIKIAGKKMKAEGKTELESLCLLPSFKDKLFKTGSRYASALGAI